MQYHHNQSEQKTPYSNVPTDGFEDIETLFGLKIRVKSGFIQDHEIQMLQNLNRLLFAVGYEKVLSVPSNFQVLSGLRNSQKTDYYTCQNSEGKKPHPFHKKQSEEKKGNYQKKAVQNDQNSEQKDHHKNKNVKDQQTSANGNKQKSQVEQKEQPSNLHSSEAKVFYNVNSLRQQLDQEESYQAPQLEQKEYVKYDYSLEPQLNQTTPCQLLTLPSNTPTQDKNFSKLKGWFFVDRSQEISNAHSLQTSVSEKSYWNILSTIWAQISVIKNKEFCKQYNITEAARNQEQCTLKSTQAYHNKCHLWMSETPYFLSTTLNETVQPSTINSQTAIYEPFDLRVIFTEDDSTNCLRSLIFGLLFNALAFQKSNNIVQQLVSSDVSITIKLVLFHIIEMQYQKKLTQRELAMNLSLLFRFNHFSGQLLSIFSSQLPGIFNTEKLIQDFAAKFNCSLVLQNVSPFGSTTKMVNPSQQIGNIIFLDITSKECALNLYYQEEKQNSCMNVYIEKLGKNFTLPSI